LREGIQYPLGKLRARRELARARRLQLDKLHAREIQHDSTETESIRLPQAQFMGEIQKPYRAQPYSGAAILIRGGGDPSFAFDPGSANGWQSIFQGGLEVEDLDCGHMDLSEEPHIAKVAQWLDKHLSALPAGPPSNRALTTAAAS
jgi:thioesterase domain-containing protein